MALAAKPSGCVVWILVDPATFETTAYRWFGDRPGRPLPALGDKAARHTKADSQGVKAERADLRRLGRGRFETLQTMDGLIERMFGDERSRDVTKLRAHLAERRRAQPVSQPWLQLIQHGAFEALPEQLENDELIELTHLADGYALAGFTTPEAIQTALAGGRPQNFDERALPSNLWGAMFIEHRRLRFQGSDPTDEEYDRLQRAYQRLRFMLSE